MNAFGEVGIVSAALFIPVFLAVLLTGPRAHLMDPGDTPGSFEPHIKRYLDLARLVLTLAAASIAFLFNLAVTRTSPIPISREYLLTVPPRAALYLCATVVFLLLFMTLLTSFYEKYSHFHYLPPNHPESQSGQYKRWKYALVNACGYTGLFLFFVAYLRLALSLL
jgi:hypothetical protein